MSLDDSAVEFTDNVCSLDVPTDPAACREIMYICVSVATDTHTDSDPSNNVECVDVQNRVSCDTSVKATHIVGLPSPFAPLIQGIQFDKEVTVTIINDAAGRGQGSDVPEVTAGSGANFDLDFTLGTDTDLHIYQVVTVVAPLTSTPYLYTGLPSGATLSVSYSLTIIPITNSAVCNKVDKLCVAVTPGQGASYVNYFSGKYCQPIAVTCEPDPGLTALSFTSPGTYSSHNSPQDFSFDATLVNANTGPNDVVYAADAGSLNYKVWAKFSTTDLSSSSGMVFGGGAGDAVANWVEVSPQPLAMSQQLDSTPIPITGMVVSLTLTDETCGADGFFDSYYFCVKLDDSGCNGNHVDEDRTNNVVCIDATSAITCRRDISVTSVTTGGPQKALGIPLNPNKVPVSFDLHTNYEISESDTSNNFNFFCEFADKDLVNGGSNALSDTRSPMRPVQDTGSVDPTEFSPTEALEVGAAGSQLSGECSLNVPADLAECRQALFLCVSVTSDKYIDSNLDNNVNCVDIRDRVSCDTSVKATHIVGLPSPFAPLIQGSGFDEEVTVTIINDAVGRGQGSDVTEVFEGSGVNFDLAFSLGTDSDLNIYQVEVSSASTPYLYRGLPAGATLSLSYRLIIPAINDNTVCNKVDKLCVAVSPGDEALFINYFSGKYCQPIAVTCEPDPRLTSMGFSPPGTVVLRPGRQDVSFDATLDNANSAPNDVVFAADGDQLNYKVSAKFSESVVDENNDDGSGWVEVSPQPRAMSQQLAFTPIPIIGMVVSLDLAEQTCQTLNYFCAKLGEHSDNHVDADLSNNYVCIDATKAINCQLDVHLFAAEQCMDELESTVGDITTFDADTKCMPLLVGLKCIKDELELGSHSTEDGDVAKRLELTNRFSASPFSDFQTTQAEACEERNIQHCNAARVSQCLNDKIEALLRAAETTEILSLTQTNDFCQITQKCTTIAETENAADFNLYRTVCDQKPLFELDDLLDLLHQFLCDHIQDEALILCEQASVIAPLKDFISTIKEETLTYNTSAKCKRFREVQEESLILIFGSDECPENKQEATALVLLALAETLRPVCGHEHRRECGFDADTFFNGLMKLITHRGTPGDATVTQVTANMNSAAAGCDANVRYLSKHLPEILLSNQQADDARTPLDSPVGDGCENSPGVKCLREFQKVFLDAIPGLLYEQPCSMLGKASYCLRLLIPGHCSVSQVQYETDLMSQMTGMLDGKCEQQGGACDPEGANAHVEEAGRLTVNMFTETNDQTYCATLQRIINQAEDKIRRCVYHQRMSVDLTAQAVVLQNQAICGSLSYTAIPEDCLVEEAQTCVDALRTALANSESGDLSYCRLVPVTQNCVTRHTSSCAPSTKTDVSESYTNVRDAVGTRCDTYIDCTLDVGTLSVSRGNTGKVRVSFPRNPSEEHCVGVQGECFVQIRYSASNGARPHKCPGERVEQPQLLFRETQLSHTSCHRDVNRDNYFTGLVVDVAPAADDGQQNMETQVLFFADKIVDGVTHSSTRCGKLEVFVVRSKKMVHCEVTLFGYVDTFDRREYELADYEEETEDAYILYENRKLGQQVEIVVSKTKSWAPGPSVCAVSVQCGLGSFTVSMCASSNTAQNPEQAASLGSSSRHFLREKYYAIQSGTMCPGFSLLEKSNGHIVNLPDGIRIDIWRFSLFLNVHVHEVPKRYLAVSRGLCTGKAVRRDGTRVADTEHVEAYRIAAASGGQLRGVLTVFTDMEDSNTYCVCPESGVTTSCKPHLRASCLHTETALIESTFGKIINPAIATATRFPKSDPSTSGPLTRRRRRSVSRRLRSRRSRDACDGVMARTEVQTCIPLLVDFDRATFLQRCRQTLQEMPTESITDILDDISSTITNPCAVSAGVSDSQQAASIITELDVVCDRDCGDHGVCRQGACVCDRGYGGKYCVIDLSVPPQIVRVGSGGNCDPKVNDNCDRPTVTAEKMSLDHVKCRIQKAQFMNDGQYRLVGKAGEVDVKKVRVEKFGASENVVSCPLPEASTHFIQLGHESYNFSTGRLYPVLDMKCYSCISFDMCMPKPLLCVVDGECYTEGAHAAGDECMICDFRRSKTSLSPKISPECYGPQPRSAALNTHDIIIISVTLPALLLTAVVFGVVYHRRKHRQPSNDCGRTCDGEFSGEPKTKEWKG